MPGRYPTRIIEEARVRFESGQTLESIARYVGLQTGRNANRSLIHEWASRHEWERQGQEGSRPPDLPANLEEADTTALGALMGADSEHRKAYRRMWRVGLEGLKEMRPNTPREAIAMIDLGIKGERAMMLGQVSMALVSALREVVIEEVEDDATRSRVARRLKEMALQVADEAAKAQR